MSIHTRFLSTILAFSFLTTPLSAQVKNEELFTKSSKLMALQEQTDAWLINTAEGRNDFKNVATHLDKDPVNILTWIHENIGISFYRGALRGPIGTIAARRANGVDQSILMGMLLHQSGYKVRFVRGTIDPVALEKYATEFKKLAKIPEPKATDPDARSKAMKLISQKTGVKIETMLKAQKTGELIKQKKLASVLTEISQQTDALGEMMDKVWDKSIAKDKMILTLSDHLWLEYEVGDKWISIDPMLTSLSEKAQKEIKPKAISTHDFKNLPNDLFHTVEIAVKAEVRNLDSKELKTHTLTNYAFKTVNYRDDSIRVYFSPKTKKKYDLQALEKSLQKDRPEDKPLANVLEIYQEIARNETEWTPIIYSNNKVIAEYSIDRYGNLEKSLSGLPVPITQIKLNRKLNDAAAAIGGLGKKEEDKPKGNELEKVYLVISLQSPQQAKKTQLRTLFNLRKHNSASPEKKQLIRSLGLATFNEFYLQTGVMTDAYYLAQLCVVQKAWVKQYDEFLSLKKGDYKKLNEILLSLSMFRFHYLKQLVHERGVLAQQIGVAMDIAEPQLFNASAGLRMKEKLMLFEHIDIMENTVQTEDAQAAMKVGVIDTVLEWKILASRTKGKIVNTANQFSNDLTELNDWKMISSVEEISQFPEESKSVIQKHLDQGYAIFVAKESIKPIWWAIHKETGRTLGYVNQGLGGTFVEYAQLLTKIAMNVLTVLTMSMSIDGCNRAIEKHGSNSCEAWTTCLGGAILTATGLKAASLGTKIFTMFGQATMAVTWELQAMIFGNEAVASCGRWRNRRRSEGKN